MEKRFYSGFIFVDDSGKVLLQHRTKDASLDPDCWAVFGGAIKDGETPAETVKREAKEELGVEANFKFLMKLQFEEKDGLHESNIFTAKTNLPLQKIKKQLTEGDDVGLFSKKGLKNINLAGSSKIILSLFFKKYSG